MLNSKRREKMMRGSGVRHGVVEARDDYGNVKKGQVGIITAYLPDENKFCVFWDKPTRFVTYNCTENELDEYFKLASMDEVLFI